MSDLFPWFCDLTREYAKDLTFASGTRPDETGERGSAARRPIMTHGAFSPDSPDKVFASPVYTPAAGDQAHASVQRVPGDFASLIGQPEPEKHALRDLEPPFVTDCEGDADSRALKLSREVMRPAGGQGGQQASNIHLSRGIDIQSYAAQEDQ